MRGHLPLAALAAAAALAALPGPALAADGGGQRAMSPDEIYALTCGHLGVSCSIGRPHAHHARAHHARAHRARHGRAAASRR